MTRRTQRASRTTPAPGHLLPYCIQPDCGRKRPAASPLNSRSKSAHAVCVVLPGESQADPGSGHDLFSGTPRRGEVQGVDRARSRRMQPGDRPGGAAPEVRTAQRRPSEGPRLTSALNPPSSARGSAAPKVPCTRTRRSSLVTTAVFGRLPCGNSARSAAACSGRRRRVSAGAGAPSPRHLRCFSARTRAPSRRVPRRTRTVRGRSNRRGVERLSVEVATRWGIVVRIVAARAGLIRFGL